MRATLAWLQKKQEPKTVSPEDLFLRIHWAGIMNESVCTKGPTHIHMSASHLPAFQSRLRAREFIYSNWPGPGVFSLSLYIPIDLAELREYFGA
jgi:hypothetical protein